MHEMDVKKNSYQYYYGIYKSIHLTWVRKKMNPSMQFNTIFNLSRISLFYLQVWGYLKLRREENKWMCPHTFCNDQTTTSYANSNNEKPYSSSDIEL